MLARLLALVFLTGCACAGTGVTRGVDPKMASSSDIVISFRGDAHAADARDGQQPWRLEGWTVASVSLREFVAIPGDPFAPEEAARLRVASQSRDSEDRSIFVFERDLDGPVAGLRNPVARVAVIRCPNGIWAPLEIVIGSQ